jgi:hypothetical protein
MANKTESLPSHVDWGHEPVTLIKGDSVLMNTHVPCPIRTLGRGLGQNMESGKIDFENREKEQTLALSWRETEVTNGLHLTVKIEL